MHYKHWCGLGDLYAPLKNITKIVDELNKYNTNDHQFPDYVSEFFNGIKYEIKKEKSELKQMELLNKYNDEKYFLGEINNFMNESINRYFNIEDIDIENMMNIKCNSIETNNEVVTNVSVFNDEYSDDEIQHKSMFNVGKVEQCDKKKLYNESEYDSDELVPKENMFTIQKNIKHEPEKKPKKVKKSKKVEKNKVIKVNESDDSEYEKYKCCT
jgi:hypothetical protein